MNSIPTVCDGLAILLLLVSFLATAPIAFAVQERYTGIKYYLAASLIVTLFTVYMYYLINIGRTLCS